MKKDKLFDVIVYRFLLSIPVSCVVNFVYGFILFLAIWAWTEPFGSSFRGFKYKIFIILISSAAILPFILFNMVRYIAIKSGHLRYDITGLIISSVPEYLFIVVCGLLGI